MKKMSVVAILVLAMATSAWAGVIYDVNTGVYEAGAEVPDIVDVVVISIVSSGPQFLCSEVPSGAYSGIRVSAGDAIAASPGDVLAISGANVYQYLGYYGLSVDVGSGDSITVTGAADVPWVDITLPEILVEHEPWHYCPIHLTEGFTNTTEWPYGGHYVISFLTDEMYYFGNIGGGLEVEIHAGECFQGAYGVWSAIDEFFVLVPDGIQVIDCSLPTQALSFGAVKSMYR